MCSFDLYSNIAGNRLFFARRQKSFLDFSGPGLQSRLLEHGKSLTRNCSIPRR
jgi:hypothetical protein